MATLKATYDSVKTAGPVQRGKRASIARFKRTVRLGFKSLWVHRLRSLLTVLGIVFGVCSVIAMLAIGEGASFEAQEQIRSLGSDNIILRSVKPVESSAKSTGRSYVIEYGLTYMDLDAIKDTIPSVSDVTPSRFMRQDIWNGSRNATGEVVGTVPWFLEGSNSILRAGRFFTTLENEKSANVCVLDAGLSDVLFPLDNPIGRDVRVVEDYYRVIGIMEPKILRVGGGGSGDDTSGIPDAFNQTGTQYRMYIPLAAAKNRFGETIVEQSTGSMSAEKVELHEVTVKVDRQEDVIETAEILRNLLQQRHKKPDYELLVPLQLLQQKERTKRIFNIVLGTIAAISLIVGGIGIMNIMLATVTERTREIGIRRALGAKRRDIIQQFLVETVMLSATGGIIGVALGLAIPFFIERFAEMTTIVTPWSPIIAFSISALVGVVFGIYPAMRAAKMDPVEALRHE